jgi:hypothetical protein
MLVFLFPLPPIPGQLEDIVLSNWPDRKPGVEVFAFPLVTGDPKTVLDQPNSLLLSESLSRKYFGEKDPIGKTLSFLE